MIHSTDRNNLAICRNEHTNRTNGDDNAGTVSGRAEKRKAGAKYINGASEKDASE